MHTGHVWEWFFWTFCTITSNGIYLVEQLFDEHWIQGVQVSPRDVVMKHILSSKTTKTWSTMIYHENCRLKWKNETHQHGDWWYMGTPWKCWKHPRWGSSSHIEPHDLLCTSCQRQISRKTPRRTCEDPSWLTCEMAREQEVGNKTRGIDTAYRTVGSSPSAVAFKKHRGFCLASLGYKHTKTANLGGWHVSTSDQCFALWSEIIMLFVAWPCCFLFVLF